MSRLASATTRSSVAPERPTQVDLGALLRRRLGDGWTIESHGPWAHARPSGVTTPVQGWKLHVSATQANVIEVLEQVVAVLLRRPCAFKVARDLDQVRELTGAHCDRVQAGKVITVYPGTDDQTRQLAAELADATAGLSGPRVLTDRPVRPGSIVSYRYGAFRGVPRFATSGMMIAGLQAPDGTVIEDRREPRFSPPDWAVDPIASHEVDGSTPTQQVPDASDRSRKTGREPDLLAGRFKIIGAVRHAARGGVFRALDTTNGRAVIIKQARGHIAETIAGEDTRARLRREAEILQDLQDIPGLPRLITTFDQEGDHFMVEDDLGGRSLSAWVTGTPDVDPRRLLAVLADVADLVATLHRRRQVLRDLGPNNIIIGDHDQVGLVDLETVLRPGEDPSVARGATPAYCAPEQRGGMPSAAADVYSFGATIAFAFTGEHPIPDALLPTMADWLNVGGRGRRLPVDLDGLVRTMCSPNPDLRPGIESVAAALHDLLGRTLQLTPSRTAVESALAPTHDPLAGATLDDAIDRLTSMVLEAVHTDNAYAAVDSSSVGLNTAPTNVHHGSSGVLLALSRHHRTSHDPEVRATLRALADWTLRRTANLPEGVPVGMSFGAGGTAYALAAAAEELDDPDLLAAAVAYALTIEIRGAGYDFTHGLAGLGTAMIDLWDRTADPRLADRCAVLADQLLTQVVHTDRGIGWPGAGGAPIVGFAHGLAGPTTFLLEAGRRFDEKRWLATARHGIDTLVGNAVVTDECARWRLDLSDRPLTAIWWCHGTAGVAIPLVRTAGVDETLLEAAARALVADRWRVGIAWCHGLAGSADTLLDLDQALPGHGWYQRAGELLGLAWSRRTIAPDGSVLLGDPGVGSVVDFGAGHAGLLAVMLRLRDGGPRLLLPEASWTS